MSAELYERLWDLGLGLILAGFFALIPAFIAERKGRSFFKWWLFGTLMLIVAIPCSLIASDRRRFCYYCGERVQRAARLCLHCGSQA